MMIQEVIIKNELGESISMTIGELRKLYEELDGMFGVKYNPIFPSDPAPKWPPLIGDHTYPWSGDSPYKATFTTCNNEQITLDLGLGNGQAKF